MPSAEIAVVIPAYNEEKLIRRTLSGFPSSVKEIIVVDDSSEDRTAQVAESVSDPRVKVIRHAENRGVGAAIYSGYREALTGSCAAFVVLAGDDQMDKADLEAVTEPVLAGAADYVKGNRLIHFQAADMPRFRRWGTRFLAWVTSRACGLPLGDSQCGYTAISRRAAQRLDFGDLWPSYGYPNDLLITLAAQSLRIVERPVRPVYADEKSGLRPWHLLSILRVIARRAWAIKRSAAVEPDKLPAA